jgi:hypothetical protein
MGTSLDALPMSGGEGVASSNLASPTKRVRVGDRRDRHDLLWELSLGLWMAFTGFNPSAPILAAPSAEWGSPATS